MKKKKTLVLTRKATAPKRKPTGKTLILTRKPYKKGPVNPHRVG